MKKYQMSVDANSREDAVAMMKKNIDQAALDTHRMEKHAGDTNPKPTLVQSHALIDQMLQELTVAPK